jgi:putative NADPH-quinone reductase
LFPTWWFGFPAVLKGWFDRVWAPGIAYDHAPDFGPIKPRLKKLKRVLVVTTLGAPWWVDRLIMRQPIKKIFKIALLSTCAPGCRFDMLSLYKSENLSSDKVTRFTARIEKLLAHWPRPC